MRKTNQILGIVALVLLLASVLSYRESVARADRFERGQKFLPNLNPEEVAQIAVATGADKVTLRRGGDGFTVVEENGYKARNDAVNRLLNDLLDITLEKEVGTGEGLAEELELEPVAETTIDVVLQDATDKEMVHLRLGKIFDDGGRYIQRLDQEDGMIFLTTQSPFLSTTPDAFLEKLILDVSADDVVAVAGDGFELTQGEDGTLALADGGGDTTAVNRLRGALASLRFDSLFLADDPEVRGLRFGGLLRFDLEDGSGYRVATAKQGDRHFLRVEGFHNVQQVAISMEETEEELEAKADTLTRADEIQAFNAFHGSWVYEVGELVAEKLEMTRGDLTSG